MGPGLSSCPTILLLLTLFSVCHGDERQTGREEDNLFEIPTRFRDTYRYLPELDRHSVYKLDRLVLIFERRLPENPTDTDEAMVVGLERMLEVMDRDIIRVYEDSVLVWEGERVRIPKDSIPIGTRVRKVPFIPTVEMMSKYLFETICSSGYDFGVRLVRVEVVNEGEYKGVVSNRGCKI